MLALEQVENPSIFRLSVNSFERWRDQRHRGLAGRFAHRISLRAIAEWLRAKKPDAGRCRNSLKRHREPFAPDFLACICTDAGYVAVRPGETSNHTTGNRVAHQRDHWNGMYERFE